MSLSGFEVADDPELDGSRNTSGRANDGPAHERTDAYVKYKQCRMSRRPADSLQSEQADEGRQRRVVGAPASQEARRETKALVSSQNSLFKAYQPKLLEYVSAAIAYPDRRD